MATGTNEGSQPSLSTLLETVQTSLSSAVASLPRFTARSSQDDSVDEASIVPPADGISLLDTKSEILLSYLQNIVFLVLLQVRQLSAPSRENGAQKGNNDTPIQDEVTTKLVELRVYLERGARPLEGRLKYQIDKVLKAAEDSQRSRQESEGKVTKKAAKRDNVSGSEDESGSGDSSGSEEEEEDQDVDELAYRPNLASFSRAAQPDAKPKVSERETGDGIYRPPKIKPTALPPPDSDRRGGRESRRGPKSRAIDEFVQAEMSGAPMMEASIGSTIRDGGRVVKTQRDRQKDTERRSYEETNFVRLPKESKKERAKRGANRPAGFGGEEWRDLGEGADLIDRLTRRGKQGGVALERSRKRRATEDGPRGDGVNVGEGFEKRQKKVSGWKR